MNHRPMAYAATPAQVSRNASWFAMPNASAWSTPKNPASAPVETNRSTERSRRTHVSETLGNGEPGGEQDGRDAADDDEPGRGGDLVPVQRRDEHRRDEDDDTAEVAERLDDHR